MKIKILWSDLYLNAVLETGNLHVYTKYKMECV